MASYKAFSPTSWKAFMDKCAALFPFLKKEWIGTRADWDLLSATDKAHYDKVSFTDDIAEGGAVVVDEVTSGNLNPVTSNAVANHNKIQNISLENITIEAHGIYTVVLADYDIYTHSKPWLAFIWNRSVSGMTLLGDGASNLLIYNTTDSALSISAIHIAVMTQEA